MPQVDKYWTVERVDRDSPRGSSQAVSHTFSVVFTGIFAKIKQKNYRDLGKCENENLILC
jgi:hypothetical protein